MSLAFACAAAAAVPRPVHVDLRAGYYLADGLGVPNAARVGAKIGVRPIAAGGLELGIAVPVGYGHSEGAGHSYWLGLEAEVSRPLPARRAAPYLAAGPMYLVSQGWDEVRFGPGFRAAVGVWTLGPGRWRFGVEPLAVERLPNGPGEPTPLRSRWGWDVTFAQVRSCW